MSYAAFPVPSAPPLASGQYAPFVPGAVAAIGMTGPEGEIATSVLTSLVNGQSINVPQVSEQAGAVVGGVIGGAYGGPLGAAVGSVVGSTVGKAIGGLFGGGDDCDVACQTYKARDQIAPQICVHRHTGKTDSECVQRVFEASYDKICGLPGMHLICGKQGASDAASRNADAIQSMRLPADANQFMVFQAELGRAAARIRLLDDLDWGNRVIYTANTTANQWGPKCVTGDGACVSKVKAASIQYALNANPFRQDGTAVPEGIAFSEMQSAMDGAIRDSNAQYQNQKGLVDAQKSSSSLAQQAAFDKMHGHAVTVDAHKKLIIGGVVGVAILAAAFVILSD